MKAQLYTIYVSSEVDIIHGWKGTPIWELFIPSLDICLNEYGNAFVATQSRNENDNVVIDLDDSTMNTIFDFVVEQTIFNKRKAEIQEKIKVIFTQCCENRERPVK